MSSINSKEKSIGTDKLSKIVSILSKEVKQEEDNLYRVLLGGFSAFTAEPLNMRILAPSSEGKTYLLEKVSQLFPEENIMKLSSASPTSFKYGVGREMIDEKGKFVSLESKIQLFTSELDKEDKESKKKISDERKKLEKESWTMMDLENKWLIFLDSQNSSLWEFFKTMLSNDTELIKYQMTNKQGGGNKQQRVVFQGKPAVIYSSAKDEARRDITSEIDTRFQTISLQANPQKYKQSIELISKHFGLVGPLYEQEVISQNEIEQAKMMVNSIIQTLKQYKEIKKPVLNPFSDEISGIFPHETGSRTRQIQRLLRASNILTLCNAEKRCKFEYQNTKYPITHQRDVSQATRLIIDNLGIPSHKIQAFNDVIKPAIEEHGREIFADGTELIALTATEILTHYKKQKEKNYSRKQLLETFLTPLSQYGFIEKTRDPENKTRDIFWIPERFENKDATIESTLFDTTTLDELRVRTFLDKYVTRRLKEEEYKFYNTDDEILSVEELSKQVTRIDTDSVETSFKN
jgi:hypothetical protein